MILKKERNKFDQEIETLCGTKIRIEAPAKINLTLDITGVLPNGYHTVSSVMHPISLSDHVTVGLMNRPDEIKIFCNRKSIPLDRKNLCAIAVEKFFAYLREPEKSVAICIEKQIPEQAGLGGGSADAAATLRALNILMDARLSLKELEEIGASFGADIPFCVGNQPALATGFGEKLELLPPMPKCSILIVKPPEGSHTGDAFKKIDQISQQIQHPSSQNMIKALVEKDLRKIADEMGNVFEEALMLPSTDRIKEKMMSFGALNALLCGSGTAVFGIFKEEQEAQKAYEAFEKEDVEVFLSEPLLS